MLDHQLVPLFFIKNFRLQSLENSDAVIIVSLAFCQIFEPSKENLAQMRWAKGLSLSIYLESDLHGGVDKIDGLVHNVFNVILILEWFIESFDSKLELILWHELYLVELKLLSELESGLIIYEEVIYTVIVPWQHRVHYDSSVSFIFSIQEV